MATTIKGPPIAGITQMPTGQHAASFSDLDDERLIGAIEAEGARLAWSRAADCPCAGVNDQTQKPDPNCALCQGRGTIYFGPRNYAIPAEAGELDDVQRALLSRDGAALIRGIVGRAAATADVYDQVGRWMWNELSVSVRQENKLGYYDRLVSIDSEICFAETFDIAAGATIIPTRYLATGVNLLRSLTTVYVQDLHFRLNVGVLEWLPGQTLAAATRLSAHYLTHPTWRVMEHPHAIREIARRRPKVTPRQRTPMGAPTPLPIQAKIQLEFLPVPRP